jgi:hypothetical protein
VTKKDKLTVYHALYAAAVYEDALEEAFHYSGPVAEKARKTAAKYRKLRINLALDLGITKKTPSKIKWKTK